MQRLTVLVEHSPTQNVSALSYVWRFCAVGPYQVPLRVLLELGGILHEEEIEILLDALYIEEKTVETVTPAPHSSHLQVL